MLSASQRKELLVAAWNGPGAGSSLGPWARLPGREPLGVSWVHPDGKALSLFYQLQCLTHSPQLQAPRRRPEFPGSTGPSCAHRPCKELTHQSQHEVIWQPTSKQRARCWGRMLGTKLGCRQWLCNETHRNGNLLGGFWKAVKSQRPWVTWSRESKGSWPVWDMGPSSD